MTFTIRESIDIQTIVRVRNIWGETFFLFLSLQIPCLIRFIVQVLSYFFECVLYNMAKLLVIACNFQQSWGSHGAHILQSQSKFILVFFSFFLCLSPNSLPCFLSQFTIGGISVNFKTIQSINRNLQGLRTKIIFMYLFF